MSTLNLSVKEEQLLEKYRDSPSSRSRSGSGGRTRSNTWEGTDDAEKRIQRHRIFIGRLPHNCTPAIIEEHFAQFGVIKRVDWPMVYDEKMGVERHQGYCFVTFASDQATERALENDMHPLAALDGREVYIEPSLQPKKTRKTEPRRTIHEHPDRTIWIGGVHHECVPEEIEAHFIRYGRVTHIKWPMRYDKRLGMNRHKGFCTLTFATVEDMELAMLNTPFFMDKYPGHEMRCTKLNEGFNRNKTNSTAPRVNRDSSLPKDKQMCRYGDQCYFGLCPYDHPSGNDRKGLDEFKRRRQQKRQQNSGFNRPTRAFSEATRGQGRSFRMKNRAMTVPASEDKKPVVAKDETPLINDALAWRVMPKKTTDSVRFNSRAKSIGNDRERYGPGWNSTSENEPTNTVTRC